MSQRPLVAMTDFIKDPDVEREVLQEDAYLLALQAETEAEIVERAGDAEGLLVFHEILITGESLMRLPRLKLISRCGVGFDNVDLQAAGELGIPVCNVPDYGTEEVADHALMLLLAVARRLIPTHEAIRAGVWDTSQAYGTPRLRGRTVGLLGCGRIGSAMALRCRAIGMRVVFYDPYKPAGLEKSLGIERCETLDELLSQSEFVSVHCPLSPETRNILNAQTLALMPMGGYVINTARGGCIQLDDLADALDSGRIQAAGLDVVEPEPLENPRIRRHPRVVLTPHSAFYSVEGARELRTKAAQHILRALRGQPVKNVVNRAYLQSPRCPIDDKDCG